MKRILIGALAVVLIVGMLAGLSACSGSGGKLICGVTEYDPINYRDANGNWTGFDTEFAKLVGGKLNMEVEFQLIEWDNKFNELNAGNITCIWNGLTANVDEEGTPRAELADMSYSYMLNQQCVVVRADRAGEFTSAAALAGKSVAVEGGSAGDEEAKGLVDESNIIRQSSQTSTFLEVKSLTADCAIVDIILARKVTGSGDYTDLTIADIELSSEVYAVAFKKGSDLTAKVNKAMKELNDEGKLDELALKYGLENAFALDTNYGR